MEMITMWLLIVVLWMVLAMISWLMHHIVMVKHGESKYMWAYLLFATCAVGSFIFLMWLGIEQMDIVIVKSSMDVVATDMRFLLASFIIVCQLVGIMILLLSASKLYRDVSCNEEDEE